MLHVLLNFSAIKGIAILICNDHSISIILLESQLDCDPLVIGDEEVLRYRLVVVLAGEEVESGGVLATEPEHEDALELD